MTMTLDEARGIVFEAIGYAALPGGSESSTLGEVFPLPEQRQLFAYRVVESAVRRGFLVSVSDVPTASDVRFADVIAELPGSSGKNPPL